jgi:hypothetical protein
MLILRTRTTEWDFFFVRLRQKIENESTMKAFSEEDMSSPLISQA